MTTRDKLDQINQIDQHNEQHIAEWKEKNSMERMNLSRKEAAEFVGVGITTIDAWLHRAKDPLPHFQCGTRKILIPRTSLIEFVEAETRRHTNGR